MALAALRSSLLALALASLLGAVSATEVTPLQKVIEMLNGMVATGKSEKHEEEVEFAKFHEWCDQVRAEKTKSIKELEDEMMQLSADIDAAEADAETLTEEIVELEKETAKLNSGLESATGIRKKENE